MKKIVTLIAIALISIASAFAGGRRDVIFNTVENGTKSQIKSEIKSDPDLIYATKGTENQTLLMFAAEKNKDKETINLLLRMGAKSKAKTKQGKTALMYACQYNTHPDVVKLLIDDDSILKSTRKNKILKKDKDGKNCYDYVAENPNKDEIIKVLQKYAPVEIQEQKTEENPEEFKEKDPAEELFNDKWADNYDKKIDETSQPPQVTEPEPAAPAVTEPVPAPEPAPLPEPEPEPVPEPAPAPVEPEPVPEPVKTIEPLITPEPPAPVEAAVPPVTPVPVPAAPAPAVDPYKQEYLFDYVELGDEEEIPEDDPAFNSKYTFIPDADKRDINGRTALMRASKDGNIRLMEDLIYSGANINAQDNDGWTPLMFASRFQKNEKAVSLLIKKGADIKKKNNYGMTALILASGFSENSSIVNFLLSKRSVSENEVRSAFIYAITNDAPISTIDLFVKKGMKINIAYDGKTPLMHAAKSNKTTKIIEYLLNNGAKTTYKSTDGKTAYQYAKENSRLPHDSIYWKLNSQSSGDN